MKIFDLFFKRQTKKLSSQDIRNLKKDFTSKFSKFKKEDIDRDELLENILTKIIKNRCEDLNFQFSYFKENNNNHLKILGDYNFFFDYCKFICISKKGQVNKDLRLKEDLYFSFSHIFLVVQEYIRFFEIDEDKLNNKLLLDIIERSEIKKIQDLVNLINDLFFERETITSFGNENI
jgi:hypothetical protein